MKTLLRAILYANRKRRGVAVSAALWVLRIVRDVEKDEMYRFEHECNIYNWDSERASRRAYESPEDEYSLCECALGFIDCAVKDLELLFGGCVYEQKC